MLQASGNLMSTSPINFLALLEIKTLGVESLEMIHTHNALATSIAALNVVNTSSSYLKRQSKYTSKYLLPLLLLTRYTIFNIFNCKYPYSRKIAISPCHLQDNKVLWNTYISLVT